MNQGIQDNGDDDDAQNSDRQVTQPELVVKKRTQIREI